MKAHCAVVLVALLWEKKIGKAANYVLSLGDRRRPHHNAVSVDRNSKLRNPGRAARLKILVLET
jgi:hypothetical protein